jgi:hypothetical protein
VTQLNVEFIVIITKDKASKPTLVPQTEVRGAVYADSRCIDGNELMSSCASERV